ncbi:LLM class flavin-dependent oxidoreductase [Streptomyces sp. NPDC055681]
MTDYGRPLSFGVSLDPSAGAWAQTRRLAWTAEDSGLDYLAVQDHPYRPGHLDAWTLITHLSAATDRISFLTDVADLQLRPPVMLATAAASLSVLTDGRIQLGVGGGGIPDAIASMGGPARRGQDMVAFTEESLGLLRAALSGGVVRLHSQYHAVGGYRAGPVSPKPVELTNGLLTDMTPDAARALVAASAAPDPVLVQLRSLGGAAHDPAPSAMAFTHRHQHTLVIASAFPPDDRATPAAWAPLAPHTDGAYVNFESNPDKTTFARAYPGPTGTRVAELWKRYDPDGVLRPRPSA